MNYILNGYSRHRRGKQGGTPKATEKAQFCRLRIVCHAGRYGREAGYVPRTDGMPDTGSCMGWDAENGEKNLVTMDSARKERKGEGSSARTAAKRQGDPWGPRDTSSGEKRKRERSQAQGFVVDVVTAFDATFQNSASKHPTFGNKIPCVIRPGANESIS